MGIYRNERDFYAESDERKTGMAYTRNSGSGGNGTPDAERHMYSVGEVCAKFNLTRKTLFYYDRIGLVKPTDRIGSQAYKVYDANAIEILQKVSEYREAGLMIEEIRSLLDQKEPDPDTVFRNAQKRLLAKRDEIEKQLERLACLIEAE